MANEINHCWTNKKYSSLPVAKAIGIMLPIFAFAVSCFAQEITIGSTNLSPDTVSIPDSTVQTIFVSARTVSLLEYIRGVCRAEMGVIGVTQSGGTLSGAQKIEAYKAQAVAAATKLARKAAGATNIAVENSEFFQTYLPASAATAGFDPLIDSAVDATNVKRAIFFLGGLAEAQYFHATVTGFTKNGEATSQNGFFYNSELRRQVTPEKSTDAKAADLSGMSQIGAKELAFLGQSDEQILKHYYGAMPPYVKKVRILQDGVEKYLSQWADDLTSSPSAPKRIRTLTQGILGPASNTRLEIEFSEEVIFPGTGIQIEIGNQAFTGGTRERPRVLSGPSAGSVIQGEPVERWIFDLTASQLANLGDGLHTLKICATHRLLSTLNLDSNPETMAFKSFTNPTLAQYEPACDTSGTFGVNAPLPTVSITNPQATIPLQTFETSQLVTISGTASDNNGWGIEKVVVNVSGVLKLFTANYNSGTGNWTAQVFMPSSGNRATIVATAIDKAGNVNSTSVTVALTTTLQMSCGPILNRLSQGVKARFTVKLKNLGLGNITVNLTHSPSGTLGSDWEVSVILDLFLAPSPTVSLGPGAEEERIVEVIKLSPTGQGFPFTLRVTATGSFPTKRCEGRFRADGVNDDDSEWPDPPPENPDDTQDVSSPNYPSVWKYDTESNVGILMSGWGEGMGHILGKFNIPTCAIDPTDFHVIGAPDRLLEHTKVLIIGSGGLWGYSTVPSIRERLRGFVEAGGTILTLTPHMGRELLALPPENTTRGFGWTEDQSCFTQAAYVENEHPVFAGQATNLLDASVDGYIDFFPQDGKVLLRRRTNGQPVLVEYPFGQGRVLVSNLYSDYGYGHGQASESELSLIHFS